MNDIFLTVLNMSLTASMISVIVLIIRLCLRRAPKKYAYLLWVVVLFRLLCPISFESPISAVPTATPIPPNIELATAMPAQPSFPIVDTVVQQTIRSNAEAVTAGNSMNPSQLWVFLLARLWLIGIAAMLCYALLSYLSLRRRLSTATLVRDNIFESEHISSPFVLGLMRPRIYLPLGITQDALSCVLLHEQAHIRRYDHIVKPLAFLALALHWFNPLLWLCYYLACCDMELSCDEKVLSRMESDGRAHYSSALLSLAAPRGAFLSPLAFGESSVKTRIKNILKWKAPKRMIAVCALAACMLTIAVCALNPLETPTDLKITAGDAQLPCMQVSGLPIDEEPDWSHIRTMPFVALGTTIQIPVGELGDFEQATLRDWLLGEDGKPQYNKGALERQLMRDERNLNFTLHSHMYTALSSQIPVSDKNPRGFRLDVTAEDGSIKTYLFALRTSGVPLFPSVYIQPAKYNEDTLIGSNGFEIYYYDGKTAIFHDYFGLFVYDVAQQKIIRSIDVEPLGLNFTQGDQTCRIGVTPGGDTVYMNAMGSDTDYVYSVSEDRMFTSASNPQIPWDTTSELTSMTEVFGMGVTWPATGRVSYNCIRTEKQAAYIYNDRDGGKIGGLKLNVYDFGTNRTISYPIFREEKRVVWEDGPMFENAFVPVLSLSVGKENWNPHYIVEQVCFKGCEHTEEYPRAESYRQLLGNFAPEDVRFAPAPTTVEASFSSDTYGSKPASVEIWDSILNEACDIEGTFQMDAPTETNGIFFAESAMKSAAAANLPVYLKDGSVLHGVAIRTTWENGDIFEYRFIARAEYK